MPAEIDHASAFDVAGRDSRLSPLNLGRCDGDTVAIQQHLVTGHGLAIDPDQVVAFLAGANTLIEQFLDSDVFCDFDVVGKSAAVVVDQ